MRDYQGKYHAIKGGYIHWPKNANGTPAPDFPGDGFYDKDVQDPVTAARVVDALIHAYADNATQIATNYRNPDDPDLNPFPPPTYPAEGVNSGDYLQKFETIKESVGNLSLPIQDIGLQTQGDEGTGPGPDPYYLDDCIAGTDVRNIYSGSYTLYNAQPYCWAVWLIGWQGGGYISEEVMDPKVAFHGYDRFDIPQSLLGRGIARLWKFTTVGLDNGSWVYPAGGWTLLGTVDTDDSKSFQHRFWRGRLVRNRRFY